MVSQENITQFLAGVPAGRRHTVRFEELVREPERVLGELCAALGEGSDVRMHLRCATAEGYDVLMRAERNLCR